MLRYGGNIKLGKQLKQRKAESIDFKGKTGDS